MAISKLIFKIIIFILPFAINAQKLDSKLRKAVKKGNIEEVQSLLQSGANINSTDKKGETVLFTAVIKHDFEMVKFLVENGIDCFIENKDGYAAWIKSGWRPGRSKSNQDMYKIEDLLLKILYDSKRDEAMEIGTPSAYYRCLKKYGHRTSFPQEFDQKIKLMMKEEDNHFLNNYSYIKNYEIGKYKENNFNEAFPIGFDAIYGKLGVITFNREGVKSIYEMGYCPKYFFDDNVGQIEHATMLKNCKYRIGSLLLAFSSDNDVNSNIAGIYAGFEEYVRKICTFTFKDGLLEELQWVK